VDVSAPDNPADFAAVNAASSSPLDPAMWGVDAIASVWDRRDDVTAEGLLARANVAEWVASTPERSALFVSLVKQVVGDLRSWDVEPRGVYPSGVGGITVAVVRGDQQMVGKWVAEISEVTGLVTMAMALGDAGLGPRVLAASAHGFLMDRVDPGVPLRSFAPSLDAVVRAARLLPVVRTLPLTLAATRHDPLASMRADVTDRAGDDADGFGARVLAALDGLAPWSGATSVATHGDYQLGNVLTSDHALGGLMLVDTSGVADAGYLDAGRLAVHATCDALGAGFDWDIEAVVIAVAAAAEMDVDGVAAMARVMAANTALYIKRCVPERAWEWQACDAMCAALDG
jgi:hypothetical protein